MMITLAKDETCYLIGLADLRSNNLPGIKVDDVEAMNTVAYWAHEFLTRPHPDLGREGAVCPFTQPSMNMNLFWLTVIHGQPAPDEAFNIILKYRDWFLSLEPQNGREAQYKTILLIFPDVPSHKAQEVIDMTQEKLKPEFVNQGLMIGQFHDRNDEPGLWNADFRPLRSPIPILAIRHMVPSDFPFLRGSESNIKAYLDRFEGQMSERMQKLVGEALIELGYAI